jgi:hypothetical protein
MVESVKSYKEASKSGRQTHTANRMNRDLPTALNSNENNPIEEVNTSQLNPLSIIGAGPPGLRTLSNICSPHVSVPLSRGDMQDFADAPINSEIVYLHGG